MESDPSARVPVGVRRGRLGEEIAAAWLGLCGFTLLDRNRKAADGEIDLVARDGVTLVFVEVRLRRARARVSAGASINALKWGRLRRCARELAARPEFRWVDRRLRFDVVLLENTDSELRVRHLRNVTGPAARR